MKKSLSKRLIITKSGKLRRRAGGLGHSRANKSSRQLLRKKSLRSIDLPSRIAKKQLN